MRLFSLFFCIVFLSACQSLSDHLQPDPGDMMVAKLRVGMAHAEVVSTLGKPERVFDPDSPGRVKDELYLSLLYLGDYFPQDLLKSVNVGTPFRSCAYWFAGGNTVRVLRLFFDLEGQVLRGWIKGRSPYSVEKFKHERLTEKLRISEGGGAFDRGMSRDEVHALIGSPMKVIPRNQGENLGWYDDHFWLGSPQLSGRGEIDVYTYRLESGAERKVYLMYLFGSGKLENWGYDHAWEERERYLRDGVSLR